MTIMLLGPGSLFCAMFRCGTGQKTVRADQEMNRLGQNPVCPMRLLNIVDSCSPWTVLPMLVPEENVETGLGRTRVLKVWRGLESYEE